MAGTGLNSRRAVLTAAALLPAVAARAATGAGEDRAGLLDFARDGREPDLVVPLWPEGRMPGGPAPAVTERVDDQTDNNGLRYRVAEHVTRPTLSYFAATNPSGAAVLIVPGGGYSRVGIDREGYETARWFNAYGVAAFVLRYRLPADRWGGGAVVALQDAQRAMRLIRAGGRWRVDPRRVTVWGGSAGGHLAISLCVKVYERTYPVIDAADRLLTRPDGAMLLYPVVSMGGGNIAVTGSRQALLGADPGAADIAAWSFDQRLPGITPPIFLAHAVHDRVVPVDHALALFGAVRGSGGAIDMHLFEDGAHGLGLRGDPAWPMSDWPNLARRWQVRNGLS